MLAVGWIWRLKAWSEVAWGLGWRAVVLALGMRNVLEF